MHVAGINFVSSYYADLHFNCTAAFKSLLLCRTVHDWESSDGIWMRLGARSNVVHVINARWTVRVRCSRTTAVIDVTWRLMMPTTVNHLVSPTVSAAVATPTAPSSVMFIILPSASLSGRRRFLPQLVWAYSKNVALITSRAGVGLLRVSVRTSEKLFAHWPNTLS